MCRAASLWALLLSQYLDARTLDLRHAAVATITGLEGAMAACIAHQKQLEKVGPFSSGLIPVWPRLQLVSINLPLFSSQQTSRRVDGRV